MDEVKINPFNCKKLTEDQMAMFNYASDLFSRTFKHYPYETEIKEDYYLVSNEPGGLGGFKLYKHRYGYEGPYIIDSISGNDLSSFMFEFGILQKREIRKLTEDS